MTEVNEPEHDVDDGVEIRSSKPAVTPTPRWVAWLVCVACVAVLPVMWQGLKQIKLKNDVESWLPENDPNARALSWYHDHFEHYDRMLVSWDSSSLDDPRVAEFAAKVRAIEGVESSTSPQDVIDRMVDNKIDPSIAAERLQGVLVGTGLMKVRLTETGRGRKAALVASIISRAEAELGFPVRSEGDASPADVARPYDFQLAFPGIGPKSERTAQVRAFIESLAAASGEQKASLIDEIFFQPGAPVAVSVSINEAGDKRLTPTMNAVRQVAYDVGVDPDELRMGGSPIGGSELNQAMLKSFRNTEYPVWQMHRRSPVILSALISVVLAFVMLRSVRLAAIVLLVGIFCVLATVSLVPVTGGSMSMVLVVMPNLLMVLTMSGAIHLANYWKHNASDAPASERRDIAVTKAVRQAATPCSMASFTTAIGLASLLTSLLTPVKDFGFYSAIGCGISLVMVLIVSPSLLRIWPGRAAKPVESDRTWWFKFGQGVVKHHKLITTVCVLTFLVGSAGLYYFQTETKVIRYFPDDSRIVRDYNRLEENLAGIVPVTVVVGFQGDGWRASDLQDQIALIRRVEQKLAEHPEISGTVSLASFIPEPPGADASRREKIVYNRKIADAIDETVHEADGSDAFVARVKTPLVTTDRGRAVAFQPPVADEDGDVGLGQEIWKITSQVSIMSDMNYATFLEEVDGLLQETIGEFETIQVAEADADDGVRDVSYIVTGTVPLFLRTQQAVLESLIRSFGLAFIVIAFVMMLVLKGFRAGLITMLPNLLPVGVVFGFVSWAGIAIDIGTMITASVALGIAVDGTLHLISWFRDRLAQGVDPHTAIAEGLTHCGPAMWQTSAIVGFGMLALLGADLLLISRFGWLMASLIGAALVADLVFLPALMAGPLGRMIADRVQVAAPVDVPVGEEPSSKSTAEPHLRLVGQKTAG